MKTKKLFTVALCSLFLFACSNDKTDDIDNSKPVTAGQPTEVTLGVATPAATRAGETVEGTDKENAIKEIEFYVFDDQGNPDAEVGKDDATPGYVKITTTANKHKVTVSSGNNKKFVALVNMNLGKLGASEKYSELKNRIAKSEFKATASENNSRDENRSGGFEMSGETVANVEADKIDNKVNVDVRRVMSKINAPTYKKNNTDPAGVDLDLDQIEELWGDDFDEVKNKPITFKANGYAVVNGISRADAFFTGNDAGDDELKDGVKPKWDKWSWTSKDGQNIAKAYLNSSFDSNGHYTNNYSGKGLASDWFLSGSETDNEHRVYVYENKPGTKTTSQGTGYMVENVYAIIVKGTLIVDGSESNPLNKVRYWRVNLIRTPDDYHIMRNCVYDVNIKNITSIGWENPEESENGGGEIVPGIGESAVDFTVKVSDWRVKEYETEI